MAKKSVTKKSMTFYSQLLADVKDRIREGQTRAMWAASTEMVATYWDVGRMIYKRQNQEGWGSGVLPKLAKDLHNELPEVKGFSVTNLKLIVQFHKEYQHIKAISQQPVGQLEPSPKGQLPVAQIPWSHNVVLMQKVKDWEIRHWYMQQVLEHGWGRDTLVSMIKSRAHRRQGKASSNFKLRLPPPQSELAHQILKDP